MSRAIQLAKRGRYTCDPNPRVGCVVVKDNQIISEGWHAVSGEAHAEINAFNQCDDIADTTVYVTLEPCSHQGRTPPCVDTLVNKKVKEVFVAMLDPNPLVSGNGIKKLEEAGIVVKQGLLEEEAKKLNPGFIKRMTSGLPYVRCKMAMSLDGRTALENGESQWISNTLSRKDVHRLRAGSSAILTTVDTVTDDGASLNARDLDFELKQPIRVVVDRQLKISSKENIFSLSSDVAGKVIVYTEIENSEQVNELRNVDAEVVYIPSSESWLENVLTHLAKEHEVNEVLVEAGSTFSGALIEAGLIDELIIYVTPLLLGDTAQPLLKLKALENLNEARSLTLIDSRQLGEDQRLTYKI
jgi:diaminohydroxyphosphoribosylaminopyrimidine deaminase / 5-amino-6-(5-phosphoribosylamino)uracil reductase